MPLLTADPVTVLPDQREALEHLVRTHSTPQQVALRARIILHAVEGMEVRKSARELGVWPKTARYWRKRWRDADGKCAVCERLADAPRSGAPATYTPEQICAVVAMTCEKPSESERPISQWTQREIADEAIRRGLVPKISQRSVGRFLKKRQTSSPIASVTGLLRSLIPHLIASARISVRFTRPLPGPMILTARSPSTK